MTDQYTELRQALAAIESHRGDIGGEEYADLLRHAAFHASQDAKRLLAERDRLREALEQIASGPAPDAWIMAREALKEQQ